MDVDMRTVLRILDGASEHGSFTGAVARTAAELLDLLGMRSSGASRVILPADIGPRLAGGAGGTASVALPTGAAGEGFIGLIVDQADERVTSRVVTGSGFPSSTELAESETARSLDAEETRAALAGAAALLVAARLAMTDQMIRYLTHHLAEERAKQKGRWSDQAAKHELADIVIERDVAEAHLMHATEVDVNSSSGRRYLILALLAAEGATTSAISAARRTAVARTEEDIISSAVDASAFAETISDIAGRAISLRTALYLATRSLR